MQATDSRDAVIAGMLTENTGRHFLDSGGAYGRNFGRNAGMSLDAFREAPAASISQYGCVTLDLFHYLSDRLDYVPEADRAFQALEDENPDDTWMDLIEMFADLYGTGEGGSWNTYNFDGDCLSQVIQGFPVQWEGDEIVLLQVHGGCDVRGGYTRPRPFRAAECFPYDCGEFTLYPVDRKGEMFSLDYRWHELTDRDGSPVMAGDEPYGVYVNLDLEWDEDRQAFRCHDGDGWLAAEAPYAY